MIVTPKIVAAVVQSHMQSAVTAFYANPGASNWENLERHMLAYQQALEINKAMHKDAREEIIATCAECSDELWPQIVLQHMDA